MAVAETA